MTGQGGRARRAAALALLFAVLAPLASACSDDPFASYCGEVEDQRPVINEATTQGATTGLLAALPAFEALAESAPDDVADDWTVVVSRIGALDDALAAADVDPATYDAASPPEGLAQEDRLAIGGAADQLLNPVTADALAEVEQHARDVCGVSLSQ